MVEEGGVSKRVQVPKMAKVPKMTKVPRVYQSAESIFMMCLVEIGTRQEF